MAMGVGTGRRSGHELGTAWKARASWPGYRDPMQVLTDSTRHDLLERVDIINLVAHSDLHPKRRKSRRSDQGFKP